MIPRMNAVEHFWYLFSHELGYRIRRYAGILRRRTCKEEWRRTLSHCKVSSPSAGPVLMVMVAVAIGFSMGYDHALTSISSTLDQLHEQEFAHDAPFSLTSNTVELLGQFAKEHGSLQNKLKEDYAEYHGLFTDKALINGLFQLNEESKSRYIRRIVKKLVEKQLNPDLTVSFTWVTAGDASAAGYGNHFEQSYTSALHDTVLSAFASVGIQFVAKNDAIGGYGSGPDLSFCMETVYGNDVDILSYDFGMMDGDSVYRAGFWGTRAAAHPSRPLLMMIDSQQTGRWSQLARLEGRGMGVALMDTASLGTIKTFLPESNTVQKMEQLPVPLQYFVCNGATEGTQSCDDASHNYVCEVPDAKLCLKAKFSTKNDCQHNKYHVNWLPGWKEHRFRGRLLGMFLANLLQESLLELDRLFNIQKDSHIPEAKRWEHMLSSFEQQDQLDNFLHDNSSPPGDFLGNYIGIAEHIDSSILFATPGECVIASRTAQALFESTIEPSGHRIRKGSDTNAGGTADTGFLISSTTEDDCGVINKDHKDFYFAAHGDNWKTIKVSVSAKREQREGFVAVCFDTCVEDICSTKLEGLDGIKLTNGNIDIEVNGEKVTASKYFDGCYFLEGKTKALRWNPSKDWSYDLRFRVNEQGCLMRIFSVITM